MAADKLKAGWAQVDITPPLDTCMAGYFRRREASGVLTPLAARALALANNGQLAIVMSCDLLGLEASRVDTVRQQLREHLQLPAESVFIHCTHTHTGPVVRKNPRSHGEFAISEVDEEYLDFLARRLADAARMAADNLGPAAAEAISGEVEGISFIRRFRMQDGSVQTNPGIANPEIEAPLGQPLTALRVLRLHREDGEELLVVHYALHPDIVGGNQISADYPGFLADLLEQHLGCQTLFLNGAFGDINHIDVSAPDAVQKGAGHARRVAGILAGEVLKVYHRLGDPGHGLSNAVAACRETVTVPLRQVTAEEAEEAAALLRAHSRGQKMEGGMAGTAQLARAYQTLHLREQGGQGELEVSGFRLGDCAFVGFPGELFSGIATRLGEESPFAATHAVSLVNDSRGYLPTARAFSEGGYEVQNSPFTPELEKRLLSGGRRVLEALKTNS